MAVHVAGWLPQGRAHGHCSLVGAAGCPALLLPLCVPPAWLVRPCPGLLHPADLGLNEPLRSSLWRACSHSLPSSRSRAGAGPGGVRCPENGRRPPAAGGGRAAYAEAPGGPGRLCALPQMALAWAWGWAAGSSACVFAGRSSKTGLQLTSARELGGAVPRFCWRETRHRLCICLHSSDVGVKAPLCSASGSPAPGGPAVSTVPYTAHCWPCAFLQISPRSFGVPRAGLMGWGPCGVGRGPSERSEAAAVSAMRRHTARLRLLGPCM